jgi:hypothetical protein
MQRMASPDDGPPPPKGAECSDILPRVVLVQIFTLTGWSAQSKSQVAGNEIARKDDGRCPSRGAIHATIEGLKRGVVVLALQGWFSQLEVFADGLEEEARRVCAHSRWCGSHFRPATHASREGCFQDAGTWSEDILRETRMWFRRIRQSNDASIRITM